VVMFILPFFLSLPLPPFFSRDSTLLSFTFLFLCKSFGRFDLVFFFFIFCSATGFTLFCRVHNNASSLIFPTLILYDTSIYLIEYDIHCFIHSVHFVLDIFFFHLVYLQNATSTPSVLRPGVS